MTKLTVLQSQEISTAQLNSPNARTKQPLKVTFASLFASFGLTDVQKRIRVHARRLQRIQCVRGLLAKFNSIGKQLQ